MDFGTLLAIAALCAFGYFIVRQVKAAKKRREDRAASGGGGSTGGGGTGPGKTHEK